MKIRLLMATATAASVLMTAGALAANTTYLTQTGDTNSASVDQAAGEGNIVGSAAKPATQQGNNNVLVVNQTNLSSLGVPTSDFPNGVTQLNHRNLLTVTQNQSVVRQVQQTGATGAPTGTTNELTITQSVAPTWSPAAIGNTIGGVKQIYGGTAGGADRNVATITQARQVGTSTTHPNSITTAEQDGTANSLLIEQTGGRQIIGSVLQRGSGNDAVITQMNYWNQTGKVSQIGDDNTVDLKLAGLRNRGLETGGWAVPYIGANHTNDRGAIRQQGDSNSFDLDISGDDNQYAAYQNGDNNQVAPILVTGNRNQLGIGQYNGNLNTILLSSITGDDNIVALRQGSRPTGSGDWNSITGSVVDDFNTAIVDQVGDSNQTTFSQVGDSNNLWIYALGNSNTLNAVQNGTGDNGATVDVDGDNNLLDVTQTATTSGNTLTAKIYGSSNNASGSFSGAAAGVAPVGLTPGEIVQNGGGQSITLDVGTLSGDSDSNLFAFSQTGSSNTISAKISGGNSNQIVVAQNGSGNLSTTVQTGNFNIIGVSQ